MAQQSTVGRVATSIRTGEDGKTYVTYHTTDVVTFDADTIRLDSGGWRTATTKTRMNQAANQYRLGFTVYQHEHEWYVGIGSVDIGKGRFRVPFSDGMVINRNAIGPGTIPPDDLITREEV